MMTTAATSPSLPLNDGRRIPQLGLGVYKVADSDAARVVETAIGSGYRHIDTATLYNNERGVGDGVRASGVPRGDIFVTTKVWDSDHGYDRTMRAFDSSLDLLRFDYVDLYLIHWPVPSKHLFVDTWRALEAIRSEGRALSIGVSNFAPHHIELLLTETEIVPAVNQVELHPWLPQRGVRDYDWANGIVTEAWSPLARGRVIGDRVLESIAARHGKTTAQVVLRWHIQLGNVVIPKSVSAARIAENIDVFDFELDADDLSAIASLESGARTGMDPDAH
ncbi:MAG: 2,5-diketo-D-gluconate reductase [Microbacteriaceae bacterium]|jgi:2,5-diketo-D-gluconate reductase A|nr:2,5-diketo-D-gluconate reductase [Microbacteriaceae bacterium]